MERIGEIDQGATVPAVPVLYQPRPFDQAQYASYRRQSFEHRITDSVSVIIGAGEHDLAAFDVVGPPGTAQRLHAGIRQLLRSMHGQELPPDPTPESAQGPEASAEEVATDTATAEPEHAAKPKDGVPFRALTFELLATGNNEELRGECVACVPVLIPCPGEYLNPAIERVQTALKQLAAQLTREYLAELGKAATA